MNKRIIKQTGCHLLLGLLFVLTGCTPGISKYFGSTRYIESHKIQIINDQLQLQLETPADIHFFRDKKSVSSHLDDTPFKLDNVLAYGSTTLSPHYRLYLMLNPGEEIHSRKYREFVQDTVLQDQHLVLLCHSTDQDDLNSFRNDCRYIFNSIQIGD